VLVNFFFPTIHEPNASNSFPSPIPHHSQLNNPQNYQRGYSEAPILNNDAFTGTGTHIHNLVDAPIIRDVWEDNFEQEFKLIMNLAEKYKVIAMVK